MTPSVERLAALLDEFDYALLTLVDANGRPRTRPVTPLRMPFNGHLWFESSAPECAQEIGRGADVSVAYAAAGAGQCVTVYGWAIVLHTPPALRVAWRTAPRAPVASTARKQLICVSARAAELWDSVAMTSQCVYAFSGARPVCGAQTAVRHTPAVAPRLVARSGISCAQ